MSELSRNQRSYLEMMLDKRPGDHLRFWIIDDPELGLRLVRRSFDQALITDQVVNHNSFRSLLWRGFIAWSHRSSDGRDFYEITDAGREALNRE